MTIATTTIGKLMTRRFTSLMLLLALVVSTTLFAGTTGKLKGKVTDATNGEPVFGANIVVVGTYFGAAADAEGDFVISNIPPGEYTVTVSAIGYQTVRINRVLIKIDLTTPLDVKISSTDISIGTEVVVTASKPLVQKDMTSTNSIVTAGEIQMMPVESVGQIINLQAGVVGGHFRGGRSNEVAYLVDGVSVTDAYNNSLSVEVENTSIRQMEVISGTFNAEYGQAMSGVVNIVTQDGGTNFEGSLNGYVGNVVTGHNEIYKNLDNYARLQTKNVQFSFSGPLGIKGLTFFTTGRYYDDAGYLFGKRVYKNTDDVPFQPDPQNTSFFIPRNTGDGEYVAMNPDRKYSFNGKITYSAENFKISYSGFWDDSYNKYYSHYWSWTPDAMQQHFSTNTIHGLQFTHYPSSSTLQQLKFSYNEHRFNGYLYEDPFDPRYVDPSRGTPSSGYTFRSGGNDGGRYSRSTQTLVAQYSLSSQITTEHKIGVGAELRLHTLFNHGNSLINLTEGQIDTLGNVIFTPGYPAKGAVTDKGSNQEFTRHPIEFSAYIQDKMEYDIMIINAGIRFDYFDANSLQLFDLRNPTKNTDFPGADQFRKSEVTYQFSPRLGASFPITDKGIIRFSYGHFFQIPSFENLYRNPDFFVSAGQSLNSVTGNPELKPQKTVMYEIGLQQVFMEDLVLNFSVYYRDVRNLLGMEILKTYEGFKYARFINRDYGNVRGFLITLDKRFSSFFSAKLDYTYQIAEGNASDPMSVFNKNQTNPPIEEAKVVVPLDWDQRHTLNLSVNIGEPGDWNAGAIFQYGSGWPYTEDAKVSNGVRFENGGIKPATYNVDLRFEKLIDLGGLKINTFLLVYNVLDINNEYGVYGTTGRANTDLNVKEAGAIIGLNTIEEYVNNPEMYSKPREIRLGFGFGF